MATKTVATKEAKSAKKEKFIPVKIQNSDLLPIEPEVYGGKAASLQRLMRNSAPVPNAWAIPCEKTFERPIINTVALPTNITYAVRSGAPTSMPGLMETKLNVKHEDLQEAVEAVWDSWDSEGAKLYRQVKNIANTGTGVVIQQWLDSEFAGVAFTCDPNSDETDYNPVAEYVKGQGNQLVSGESTNHIKITDWNDNPMVQRLNLWLEHLHTELGPSDIEWAYKDTVLYLLQWRKLKLKAPDAPEEKIEGRELLTHGKPIGFPKAAILKVAVDVEKFEDGDALYVDAFSPEYYPYMMRAGAILCKAGGETCHAAIIARDIGIPAISNIQLEDVKNLKKAYFSGKTGGVYSVNADEKIDIVKTEVVKVKPVKPNIKLINGSYDMNLMMLRFYNTINNLKIEKIDKVEHDRIIREIAHISSSYMFVISMCEMRHINRNSKTAKGAKEIRELQLRGCRIPNVISVDRTDFKNRGCPQPGNIQRTIEILDLCTNAYNNYEWGGAFGGPAWGKISKLVLDYYKGEVSDILFVDSCFNYYHNGGRIFGKFGMSSCYCNNNYMNMQLTKKTFSFKALYDYTRTIYNHATLSEYLDRHSILPSGYVMDMEDKEDPLLNEPALLVEDAAKTAAKYNIPAPTVAPKPSSSTICTCAGCLKSKAIESDVESDEVENED